MKNNYLIEYRFRGKQALLLKKLIHKTDKVFRLGHVKKNRPVPHISIVAPFTTKYEKKLTRDFKEVCNSYKLFNFYIKGFGTFDKARVVFIKIIPSDEMNNFRYELIKRIKGYCKLKGVDLNKFLGIFDVIRKHHPHITIAKRIPIKKFNYIRDYVFKHKEKNLHELFDRVTLIKNNKILYEYDFLLRRLLNRRAAIDKNLYNKELRRF